jgi:ribose 5-phosphate isomerase A
MPSEMSPIDKAKYVAARRAVEYVEDGMRVGLGTGSTAVWMVRCLGEMVREEGMMITTVATSRRTAELARSVGLDVRPLDDVRWLDLTIDGADEFDPGLNLIKGGGGALLHEKIVATASDQMVVIADRSNTWTGSAAFPLPVEIVPFGWQTTKALVEEMLSNVEVMGRSVDLRLERGRTVPHRRGQLHPRPASAADLQPRAAEPHPQPDPGCRGERAVPRYLRRGDHRQFRRHGGVAGHP